MTGGMHRLARGPGGRQGADRSRAIGAGALGLALALGLGGAACRSDQPEVRADRRAVTPEGQPSPRLLALRDSLRRRVAGDTLLRRLTDSEADVTFAVRTDLVREIAAWLAGSYLNDVRLHLTPDLIVEHGETVRTKVGPIGVRAGEWNARIRIRSIRADLRVGAVEIAAADSNLMRATVSVAAENGYGEATVDFAWDAAALPSLLCDDFEAREELAGTIPADRYRVQGWLGLRAVPEGISTVPDFSESPIRVSPRPTPESWARIRAALVRAEEGCGPLDPDDLLEKLEGVFERGFEFELPESIFRPVHLPTQLSDRVTVAGREVVVGADPAGLEVGEAAIWYGTRLTVRAGSPLSGG